MSKLDGIRLGTTAGISIELLCDPGLSECLPSPFLNASPPGIDHQVRIEVHIGERPDLQERKKVFDSGEIWSLYLCGGRVVLLNDLSGSPPSRERILVMDPDFKYGKLYVPGALRGKVALSDYLLYPINQLLFILVLSKGRGLLLHACAIRDREKCFLFLGNSGHGKSTMAELWHKHGALVLNDDRIVLMEKDGRFWVFGTPWHGDFRECSSEGWALDSFFFLSQGKANEAIPKKGAEAVSMLLTRSFPPLWDKDGMAFTMDLCHRLTETVPCYELSFLPDGRVLDLIRTL